MNRRDLVATVSLVPLMGLSAYPEIVAAKVEGERAAPIDSDNDIFHAVYMFDYGVGNFIVRGIYTIKAEADAHAARLKTAGSKCCGSLQATRAWLQNHFIGERMGAMQDVLERLEARLMIDANG